MKVQTTKMCQLVFSVCFVNNIITTYHIINVYSYRIYRIIVLKEIEIQNEQPEYIGQTFSRILFLIQFTHVSSVRVALSLSQCTTGPSGSPRMP